MAVAPPVLFVSDETYKTYEKTARWGWEALQAGLVSTWLTSCDAGDYPYTRDWARAIRGWAPEAHGFVWQSARLNDRSAFVLFDDRCDAAWFSEVAHPALGALAGNPGGHALDQAPGLPYLRALLVDFGCMIA